jgi:hypothetical protein
MRDFYGIQTTPVGTARPRKANAASSPGRADWRVLRKYRYFSLACLIAPPPPPRGSADAMPKASTRLDLTRSFRLSHTHNYQRKQWVVCVGTHGRCCEQKKQQTIKREYFKSAKTLRVSHHAGTNYWLPHPQRWATRPGNAKICAQLFPPPIHILRMVCAIYHCGFLHS